MNSRHRPGSSSGAAAYFARRPSNLHIQQIRKRSLVIRDQKAQSRKGMRAADGAALRGIKQ